MLRNGKLLSLSLIVVLALALSALGALRVSAGSGSVTYQWLIGVNGLETPDIAQSSDGATVALTGMGMLSVHPKSVSGGGDFVHMAPDGTVAGMGTWTVTCSSQPTPWSTSSSTVLSPSSGSMSC